MSRIDQCIRYAMVHAAITCALLDLGVPGGDDDSQTDTAPRIAEWILNRYRPLMAAPS